MEEQMTLLYSGGEKREAGVGFMVDSWIARRVLAFQLISNHLTMLPIGDTIKTHLLAVYTLTETSSDETKDNFYNQLQHMMDLIAWTKLTILEGDVNSHVGSNHDSLKETLGTLALAESMTLSCIL